MGYIIESGYYQADLLRKRVPLQYALDNYKLTEEERNKIQLTIELRKFMKEELGLDTENNYSRYVHLDRKYVSYAVNAAPKNELKQHTWSFPSLEMFPTRPTSKKKALRKSKKNYKIWGLIPT